jgi:hypothetical protein
MPTNLDLAPLASYRRQSRFDMDYLDALARTTTSRKFMVPLRHQSRAPDLQVYFKVPVSDRRGLSLVEGWKPSVRSRCRAMAAGRRGRPPQQTACLQTPQSGLIATER